MSLSRAPLLPRDIPNLRGIASLDDSLNFEAEGELVVLESLRVGLRSSWRAIADLRMYRPFSVKSTPLSFLHAAHAASWSLNLTNPDTPTVWLDWWHAGSGWW